jgi:hypothetical protein
MKKKNYSVQVYWTSREHSMTGFYTTYRIQAENERTAQNWALSKALKENNSNFTKTVEFNSIYNSCIIFDGHNYHSADHYYDKNCEEDRLTLITFFKKLSGDGLKYSGSELNRI